MMLHSSRKFQIKRLQSGGLITNYHCTSQCRHCLYACGPGREKRYIDAETAAANLQTIKALGCRSIHVGGGEPFLDPQGLGMVLESARRAGIGVEYVETNSSWFRDAPSATALLKDLAGAGLRTLLVSISPFHNEHIPFNRVKGVLEACETAGISVFPWIGAFYPEVDSFDGARTHGLGEFEQRFGPGYVKKIPSRYWIHFGGRALNTFRPVFGGRPPEEILRLASSGCSELADTSHFHLDLDGNYLPGLCSGLAIARDDLGGFLSSERYPLLNLLYHSGIRGIYELAVREHGFQPRDAYLNKCDICTDIRRWLVVERGMTSRELSPPGFYASLQDQQDAIRGL